MIHISGKNPIEVSMKNKSCFFEKFEKNKIDNKSLSDLFFEGTKGTGN